MMNDPADFVSEDYITDLLLKLDRAKRWARAWKAEAKYWRFPESSRRILIVRREGLNFDN